MSLAVLLPMRGDTPQTGNVECPVRASRFFSISHHTATSAAAIGMPITPMAPVMPWPGFLYHARGRRERDPNQQKCGNEAHEKFPIHITTRVPIERRP
jgi:hypothetical protein